MERAVWQALDLPELAAEALHDAAAAARNAGRLTQAMAAAHELSSLPNVLTDSTRAGGKTAHPNTLS